MKKLTILSITLIFLGLSLASVAETAAATSSTFSTKPWWKSIYELSWSGLPNANVPCNNTSGEWLNNKYYQICGGMTTDDLPCPSISCWNGSSWSTIGTHPGGGVEGHSSAIWNNRIVISGGINWNLPGSSYNYSSVFNPSDNTWVQSTPIPLVHLWNTAMESINNKCFLFGGWDTAGYKPDTYTWTPGDSYMITKASMPAGRSSQASSVYNGKIYAFGGNTSYLGATNGIWQYDPSVDSWSVKSAILAIPRYGARAVTIGDRIYVLGGYGGGYLDSIEVYDPISDTISAGTQLPYATTLFGAAGYLLPSGGCSYTGHIIISGGSNAMGPSFPIPLPNAAEGTVLNVTPTKVQPTSLGSVKALYH